MYVLQLLSYHCWRTIKQNKKLSINWIRSKISTWNILNSSISWTVIAASFWSTNETLYRLFLKHLLHYSFLITKYSLLLRASLITDKHLVLLIVFKTNKTTISISRTTKKNTTRFLNEMYFAEYRTVITKGNLSTFESLPLTRLAFIVDNQKTMFGSKKRISIKW